MPTRLGGTVTARAPSTHASGDPSLMFWHMVGNKVLSLATKVLYNTTLFGMETWYELFDREVLASPCRRKWFGFEPEVTACILYTGERIYKVLISYDGREAHEGKKIIWRDGFDALCVLLRCHLGPGRTGS